MDQKRLVLAIAISVAILVISQIFTPRPPPRPHPEPTAQSTTATPSPEAPQSPVIARQVTNDEPAESPRLRIDGTKVEGSIRLLGARIDDLVLRDYRETIDPQSPLVRLFEKRTESKPYYAQFGWTAAPGAAAKLPDNATLWTASADTLRTGSPVTLSWDNGEGLTFEIVLAVDDNYVFSVQQRVHNAGSEPVALYPFARVDRDYTPKTAGYYILFEGMLGVAGGSLQEWSYQKAKDAAEKLTGDDRAGGVAYSFTGDGGWAGFTDKYWLAAVIPDQTVPSSLAMRHLREGGGDRYQVDYRSAQPQTVAPGGEASLQSHLFAGAKVVALLDHYEQSLGVANFRMAVDWGWFWFLTQPIFYAIDWLNGALGNFGLAIMVFTVFAKLLFFPLANYSYRSMSKMKLLAPKVQALRERFKDEPQRLQSEMMALYRTEKINPASGCLPMLIQIPVFFSLYKVIFVTIEMRQAPFFGWIRDLSASDPTNVFNLFGLLPFDPSVYTSYLHLGVWPLIMGCTMYLQQRLNPPPPDPVQARVFQLMPIGFTLMLANFPAGLVIYWSWNNLLSIGQQWLIMRRTHLLAPSRARA
jgi:YidC/Oxa1 family membrane protein insertase